MNTLITVIINDTSMAQGEEAISRNKELCLKKIVKK